MNFSEWWKDYNSKFTATTQETRTDVARAAWEAAQNNEQPTLRDRFAMSALPALIADHANHDALNYADGNTEVAKEAYRLADAMMKERSK